MSATHFFVLVRLFSFLLKKFRKKKRHTGTQYISTGRIHQRWYGFLLETPAATECHTCERKGGILRIVNNIGDRLSFDQYHIHRVPGSR